VASIHSFSLPDGFEAGASFMLSKEPWSDHCQEIDSFLIAVKPGQARVHVALPQISDSASADDIARRGLPVAQKFLDLMAVQAQLAYRIVNQGDSVVWRRTSDLPKLQVSATLPIGTGMSANPQLIDAEGKVITSQAQSPNAESAFRYYRFASSSADLFESYRYLFLSFESALDDLEPQGGSRKETQWLNDALEKAISEYSLDLSAYSKNPSDAVSEFINKHYSAIRCGTFHAKIGALSPGDPAAIEQVRSQLTKFQPLVKGLLNKHFGAAFRSSGATSFFLNSQLESLTSAMLLLTSPRQTSDLAKEVRSAFTQSGFDEVMKSGDREHMERELPEVMGKAQNKFPFDLLPTNFEGKRPGYDDQWIITATRRANDLAHREVRSMALSLASDPDHPFLRLTANALTTKTISTDLDVTGIGNIVYKLRIVHRRFQEFPTEFASY
jgi:hypothetical protein